MTTPPPQTDPPRRSRIGRWLFGIGGCLGVVLVCAGIVTFCPGILWFAMQLACYAGVTWYEKKQANDSVGRVFEEALADGDSSAAYERADPDFRKAYTREQFEKFAQDHGEIFQRNKLSGTEVNDTTVNGERHVVLKVRVEGLGEVVLYCRNQSDGKLVLIGIAVESHAGQSLDVAVPTRVKNILRPGVRSRKSGWDD